MKLSSILLGNVKTTEKRSPIASLLKGDITGHEFHGNQYQIGSVGELGGNKDYNQVRGSANTLSAEAVRTGNANDHKAAAEAHREAAAIAQHSLSTRSAVLTHIRMAEEHESKSSGASRTSFSNEEKSLAEIIAERKAGKSTVSLMRKNLDNAAHEAATSPLNLRAQPTEAQANAGNYKKGHVNINGIKIAIENPAGSKRRPEWPTLTAHYGYVKGTEGADGGAVDIFVRPSTPTDYKGNVFVIDQLNESGEFDENKVMLGWDNEADAKKKAYLSNYTADWNGFGSISEMTQDEFKSQLRGDVTNGFTKDEGGVGWVQSSTATSGITAYGNTGKKRIKLKSRRTK